MKNTYLSRLCALLLALLLALSAFALAEEAAPEAESAQVEEAAADEGPLTLAEATGQDVHFKGLDGDIDDTYYEYVLKKSSAEIHPMVGDTIYIDLNGAEGSKWKSNNTKVATVDEDGEVECLKPGTAKITVKATKGKTTSTRTLTLKVYDPYEPKVVNIFMEEEDDDEPYYFKNNEKWHTFPGAVLPLQAEVLPEYAEQEVTWKTDAHRVADIEDDGEVTALKTGKAKITATAENGKKATLYIYVDKNTYKPKITTSKLKSLLRLSREEEEPLLAIKYIEVESVSKVHVTFILVNGTSEKITKLTDLSVTVDGGYYEWDEDRRRFDYDSDPDFDEFLSKDVDSVKVSCGKNSTKEFKLTFRDDEITEPFWWLGAVNFTYEVDASFEY